MILLMSFGTGCATTDPIPLGADLQKIEKGEQAPEDGVFLTVEGTKKVAQVYAERKALRKELANSPTQWERFWTNSAIFVVGIGVGVWVIP